MSLPTRSTDREARNMNRLEAAVRRVDAFQQRHLVPAFVIALTKKYGDDNAGALSVQLAYTLFTSIFPLLLLLTTILSLLLAHHPSWRNAALHSTFSQFPIVGSQLSQNIHVMRRNSTFGLVVGILGLIYGTTGLAGTGLYVMEQVWNIPFARRPNYWTRMGRSLTFLGLLGFGLIVTTFLSGFGTFSGQAVWYEIAAEALAALVNVALYLAAFRVLTPKQVGLRSLIPGVVAFGVIWTVLQALGGYVVGHYLRDDNATYGVFATVLGLIAWLYLGAEVFVYSAELNVVLARRLWPRTMVQPPLSKADQVSIALQATENQRRPEQVVETSVRGMPMTQDEYAAAGRELDLDEVGTAHRVPDDGEGPPAPDAPTTVPGSPGPGSSASPERQRRGA
jgi:YihY family inner membrane protein